MGCSSGAVGTGRWEAAVAGRRIAAGRERTTVLGVKGRALLDHVLTMRNTTTPLGSGGLTAGRPTVRKAQFLSGRRMTQEAKADSRNGDGKPGNRVTGISAGWFPHNWSDTGGCPARKGADVGRVSL